MHGPRKTMLVRTFWSCHERNLMEYSPKELWLKRKNMETLKDRASLFMKLKLFGTSNNETDINVEKFELKKSIRIKDNKTAGTASNV